MNIQELQAIRKRAQTKQDDLCLLLAETEKLREALTALVGRWEHQLDQAGHDILGETAEAHAHECNLCADLWRAKAVLGMTPNVRAANQQAPRIPVMSHFIGKAFRRHDQLIQIFGRDWEETLRILVDAVHSYRPIGLTRLEIVGIEAKPGE